MNTVATIYLLNLAFAFCKWAAIGNASANQKTHQGRFW